MNDAVVDQLANVSLRFLQGGALLLVFVFGLFLLYLLYLYLADTTQQENTVRRNFPVIGRFRSLFEHLGVFFRQYFFAMDREEMPFNRAQRGWVYLASENADTTVAFGSTRSLGQPNEILFLNCPFPTLQEDAVAIKSITIGRDYAATPYTPASLFNISGMSFGALSKPAVQALSRGAAAAGIWLNTGEGGLSPYHLEGGCDLVFQIGTAKYGVRDDKGELSSDRLRELAAIEQLRMFEIKLSQGAKPGKGGLLPGCKVNAEIARIRGIPEAQDSISPNRHPDIGSIDELLDSLEEIRRITGKPVGFKTVVGSIAWFDELFQRVHQRGLACAPDFITVDSADGGTGAAPQSLIDYVGLPLRASLPRVVDKVSEYGLRERVRIVASGKLINPGDVAWALCVGADFVNSARGFMFSLGCIQALKCNRDTCPTGITTHNPELQRGLVPSDKSQRVAHYARHVLREVGVIAHACGVAEARQLRRHHAQLVDARGIPEPLESLYPSVVADPKYLAGARSDLNGNGNDLIGTSHVGTRHERAAG